jgi:hypothetical protein
MEAGRRRAPPRRAAPMVNPPRLCGCSTDNIDMAEPREY